MPYSSIKIKNIAHRGFSTLAPQNTLPAFELAGKSKKVYGIETDVHATKDGRLIVIHDDTLNTTTDITSADENYGKPVEKMNYEEVEKYNVETKTNTGNLKAGTIYKNLHIPTAEDYIKICKKYNKIAIIELKGFNDPKYYQQLTDLIFRENMQKKTVFISGKLGQLENMKETVSKASTIPMMPIFYENTDTDTDDYINLNGFTGIDINIKKTTTNTLKTLRSQKVGIWTVKLSDIKKAAELVKSGAEYITADSEDVMSKVYDSVYPSPSNSKSTKTTKETKETKKAKNTKNTKAAKNTKTSKKAKSSKVVSTKTKKKTDTKSKKNTKNTKNTQKGKSTKKTVKKASPKKKTKKNDKTTKKASKKACKKR
jgi:glycerophosphoryl diester phosphodiesterase